jgi:hypothetical protein
VCYQLGRGHLEGGCGCAEAADEVSFYYAKIADCAIKGLGPEEEAEVAEWLQAHPVMLRLPSN